MRLADDELMTGAEAPAIQPANTGVCRLPAGTAPIRENGHFQGERETAKGVKASKTRPADDELMTRLAVTLDRSDVIA